MGNDKKEFKRNKKTGILEIWENGKKTGEIITMGDIIIRETKKDEGSNNGGSKRKHSSIDHR